MSTYESIEEITHDIDQALESAPSVKPIPITFISGSPKLQELLKASSNVPAKFRNQKYTLSIDGTFLIRNIQFQTAAAAKDFSKNFEIKVQDIEGQWTKLDSPLKDANERIRLLVNKVLKRIEIHSKNKVKLEDRPEIRRIAIFGYREDDFEKIAEYANDLLELRNEINEIVTDKEEELKSLEALITQTEEKNAEITQDTAEVEGANIEAKDALNRVNNQISSEKQQLSTLEEKSIKLNSSLSQIETSIEEKSDEKKKLISETNDLKNDLKRLIEDKNTFSSELYDYINEGEKNIKKYYWLSSIPIIIMATLTAIIIYNSIELFQTKESLSTVASTVLSRIPFTLATLGLIAASFKICKFFISQMTRIYDERLAMTKLSIVAKEVSNSIFDEEDDPEIKYSLRAQLKMDLLKQYMKNEIGEDFKLSKKYEKEELKERRPTPDDSEAPLKSQNA